MLRSCVTLRPLPQISPRIGGPCRGSSQGPSSQGKDPEPVGLSINEDVLARLKAAEEEAAMLRRELAAAKGAAATIPDIGKPKRIDSVDQRESVFADGNQGRSRGAWLSESDVDLFVGSSAMAGGPSGESRPSENPEVEQVVQRRLVAGVVAVLGISLLALVPSESLRLKPSRPMHFYIVPLLRIKNLLSECKPIIEDADWSRGLMGAHLMAEAALHSTLVPAAGGHIHTRHSLAFSEIRGVSVMWPEQDTNLTPTGLPSREQRSTLRIVLPRVLGAPNNARANLDSIVALLDDVKTAEKAQRLATEFCEYLDSIDYDKYFDAMPTRTLSGVQNAQYSEFSGQALQAAVARLEAFLALLPAQAREEAQAQLVV